MSNEDADRLAEVAMELAQRVREEAPEANRIWLSHMLPNPADREALLFVLAAAVPLDKPWRHLTAWTWQPPPKRQPCGSRAAHKRHLAHGEDPCQPCIDADREYERTRYYDRQQLAQPVDGEAT